MSELKFSPVDEIIADLKAGKLVIVADDPGRENEADLVGAASLITPESIAFMANHGRTGKGSRSFSDDPQKP
jgi:3,4-dihydroxy 2-butanone 4-phosphate synthase/GTP cyclohydrolase II